MGTHVFEFRPNASCAGSKHLSEESGSFFFIPSHQTFLHIAC